VGYYCSSGVRTACPAGTWTSSINITSSSQCTSCPTGYSSLPSSTSANQCSSCSTGYYMLNGVCSQCPGAYSTVTISNIITTTCAPIPVSYSYSTIPTNDTSLLTDNIIGSYVPSGGSVPSQWVTWQNQSPTITFRFPGIVTINKVSIHFQGDRVNSICLPSSVVIGGITYIVPDTATNGWKDFVGTWSSNVLVIKLVNRSTGSKIYVSDIKFAEPASITSSSWPSLLTGQQLQGTYAIVQSGSSPNVEKQLGNITVITITIIIINIIRHQSKWLL